MLCQQNGPFKIIRRSEAIRSHRRYPYFDMAVGPAWSNDPESNAGGSVATGRSNHAGQVKDIDPD